MEKSQKVFRTGFLIFLVGMISFFYFAITLQMGPGTAEYCWDLENALERGLKEGYYAHEDEGGPVELPRCFDTKNFEGQDFDLRENNLAEYFGKEEILFDCNVKNHVSCSPYRLQIHEDYEDFEFSYRVSEGKIYIEVTEIKRENLLVKIEEIHIITGLMLLGIFVMIYGKISNKK